MKVATSQPVAFETCATQDAVNACANMDGGQVSPMGYGGSKAYARLESRLGYQPFSLTSFSRRPDRPFAPGG